MKELQLNQMEQIEGGSLGYGEAAGCLISTGVWAYGVVIFALTGVGAGLLILGGAAIALGCILK